MRRHLTWVLALPLLTACKGVPVSWSDVSYSAGDSANRSVQAVQVPDSAACKTTGRAFPVGTRTHAMWWSIRPDSSARLMYSQATGGAWNPPVAVDTTDRSRRGCDRPAPAIAADNEGRIYAAYFLEPDAGSGIFFVHKMDETGFHDPVSISYGKRASEVSVATEGDKVVVAYEEPNAERGQIWVALSSTMGHLFEYRGSVSGASELSRHPLIQLHGTKLEVSWLEQIQSDSSGSVRLARTTGTWK